jgi:hypothetical protein
MVWDMAVAPFFILGAKRSNLGLSLCDKPKFEVKSEE